MNVSVNFYCVLKGGNNLFKDMIFMLIIFFINDLEKKFKVLFM